MGAYFESAAGTITYGEGSAEQSRPFPHADQAMTQWRRAGGAASRAVVLNDDVDGGRAQLTCTLTRAWPACLSTLVSDSCTIR